MIIRRRITAELWRLYPFRVVVLWYVMRGWPGAGWLANETPLMLGLKQAFVDCGDIANAAECHRLIDGWERRRVKS